MPVHSTSPQFIVHGANHRRYNTIRSWVVQSLVGGRLTGGQRSKALAAANTTVHCYRSIRLLEVELILHSSITIPPIVYRVLIFACATGIVRYLGEHGSTSCLLVESGSSRYLSSRYERKTRERAGSWGELKNRTESSKSCTAAEVIAICPL